MPYPSPEKIRILILSTLMRNPNGLRFNELLHEIHKVQDANPKEYVTRLSKRTLAKYLSEMIASKDVIKEGKLYKSGWIYDSRYYFSEIMISLTKIFEFLGYPHHWEHPFYDLPILFKRMNKNRLSQLKEMLMDCVKIIDRYLESSR